ncbi:AraC family transcriptional regulator [Hymenobacter sp. YC55]|uniref:helix-turn-helix domain-containing protein n=1 Tax=Hymenobacter sp. YC55 TaxID=3034019 RepID=UPI0023F932FB|nr:AraC family transcriptional regulator [Hymenobacter sp. YC55]
MSSGLGHRRTPGWLWKPDKSLVDIMETQVLAKQQWKHLSAQLHREPLLVAPVSINPVEQTQLIVQLSGAQRVGVTHRDRQERHETKPGTMILTGVQREGFDVEWMPLSKDPLHTMHLYLSNELLARTATEMEVDVTQIEMLGGAYISDPLLLQLSFALAQELKKTEASNDLYVDTIAQMMAVQMVRQHCTRSYRLPTFRGKLSPARLGMLRDYVQAHLEEPILLEDLAAVACMSPYHFCRVFKQTTKLSPNQYVIQQRMARAMELLRLPECSVTQVAYAVGYRSPGHFAQLFQRHTKCSPVEFQQLHR